MSLEEVRDERRDVAGSVISALLRYVRRSAGEDGLHRVLQRAGEPLTPGNVQALLAGDGWFSHARVIALADAAAGVTGDDAIGQRAGEELARATASSGFVHFMKAAGSPSAALVEVISYGTKMARGRRLEAVEIADDFVVVEGTYEGMQPHPFMCAFGPGFWAQVPLLFGATGTAIETGCQARGEPVCTYLVRWEAPAGPAEDEVEREPASAEALIAAFERLQSTASELAKAESLDDVLQRVVQAADRVLVCARFVAVMRRPDGRLVCAARGLSEREAARCSRLLLADSGDETYGVPVVAPLTSTSGEHGLIAALLPPGAVRGGSDERLLTAYAGHASAVLDAVMARESAKQSDSTSRALFDLAQRLAAVTTPAEVCHRVVDTVPGMIDCRLASFWRWDEVRREFWLAAHRGPALRHTRLSEDDVNGIASLDTERLSVLLDLRTVSAEKLRSDMLVAGVRWAVVTPVSARGTLLGVVTIGFGEERALDENLSQRLLGVADIAATALDNALLVEQMRHESLHDALTGLPNRPLIEDRAEQALRSARRRGRKVALLFIDLDRFKNVNDTLGHTSGDALIRQVATRLGETIRHQDTLARMGGDEFVLLVTDTDEQEACAVAEKLMDTMQRPFLLEGRQLYISCSVGVAVWPDHGVDYENLLLNADAAMYEAKAAGRGTYSLHADVTARRRELLDLEHRLRGAIDDEELVVLYQPQVDLLTRRLIGVEALVRWDHPELGRLGPDRFLHLAEESGVIVAVDAFVRRRAFAQAKAWADAGLPLRVSVNLSTADLRRRELPSVLSQEIVDAGLAPELVEIEITDRVALGENDLRPMLRSLSELGVRLAVDDFGVGSSVLGRLQHGPFDTLKVDRSLVSRIDEEPRQAAILQALVTMAHEIDLTVVAEGVETPAQANVLRRFDCELAQGYLFSQPVEAAGVDHILAVMASGLLTA